MERTLALIKPDAFASGQQGSILARIQENGLTVVAAKSIKLSKEQAEGFYRVHRERPFFGDLVRFMTEGPIMALVLQGEHAVQRWRDLMGPTDAEKAPKGTIRGDFGTNVERNATHGSDSQQTAAEEVAYFFSGLELAGL